MRLFHKLILLSILPVLITVSIIIVINRTITDSTLRIGMERAALEHFAGKAMLLQVHFQKNKELLRTLAAQSVFVSGDWETRKALLDEWEDIFPDDTQRLYLYDGTSFHASGGGEMPWDAEELGLERMGDSLVTRQFLDPVSGSPQVLTWVRLEEGALGVAHPVGVLRRLLESMQADGVEVTCLMDANYQHHLIGPKAAQFFESPTHEKTLQSLLHMLGETALGMFTLQVNGTSRHVVAGAVPNTDWKIALVFDDEAFYANIGTVNNLNLLVLGLSLVPLLLIVYAMNLTMIRPLNNLMEAQRKIGQGDLDVRIEGLPRDEIGQLGDSLNVMASNLRALRSNLASSEQRFRLLAENIPGVIYLCNNDEHYSGIYLNDSIEGLSGYPKEVFLEGAVHLAQMFHPEDRDYVFAEVGNCLEKREPFQLEYRIIHRSGEVRWVEEFGTGVWEGDKLLFLEGVISDITKRKKAEDILRVSETRYRALFEGANHSIMIMSPDTTILMLNDKAAEVFRRPASKCAGKSLHELLPEFEKPVMERMTRAVQSNELGVYEDMVQRPEGGQWYLSFHQHVPLPGEPDAVLIASYDITDRKRAEEALRYRLEFENLLSDMSTNFINIEHGSIDHAVTDSLAALAQFIGCDGAYAIEFSEDGEHARMTHSWQNGALTGLNELLRGVWVKPMSGWRKKIMHNEMNMMNRVEGMRVIGADGELVTPDMGIRSFCEVPLVYQDRVLGLLGLCNRSVGHDWTTDEGSLLKFAGHVITNALQRKEAEASLVRYRNELERLVEDRTEALEQAQAELVGQERLATLGQLTATVSHELRNPLGTIRGSFFTIAERTRGKNLNIERALERVERNIIRCDTIIEELLDFTRSRNLELTLGDPDGVVYDLVEDYPVPRNLHLEVDLGVGAQVQFDPEKFRRCVVNILNNACEAMREIPNSTVCKVGSTINLHSRMADGVYRLEISDNGPGIPQDVLGRIYEPLFSTKGFGVGLGLTLVRQIMELHGGEIAITSTLEKGTQILLTLPLKANVPEDTA